MQTNHREMIYGLIFVFGAILALRGCRAETVKTVEGSVSSSRIGRQMLSYLDERYKNRKFRDSQYIQEKWGLNETYSDDLDKVCKVVFLRSLEDRDAAVYNETFTSACNWLYYEQDISSCEVDLYYYCFKNTTESMTPFLSKLKDLLDD